MLKGAHPIGEFKVKTTLISLVSLIAFTGCNSGGPTYITSEAHDMSIISVSATATSNVAPDRAVVSAGILTQGRSAREAMQANATLMTDVFEQLDDAGIAKKNIQTSQLSLQPRFDYSDRRAPTIEGYDARNQVTVKSDDIEKVGPMLDALVAAGVNTINNVSFEVKDTKAAKNEARTQAVKDAKDKAEAMAEAAGVSLGKLISMNEGSNATMPNFPSPGVRMEMAADMANTPVSAGEQTLSVTVSLSYSIIQ